MDTEVEQNCGAGRHERSEGRINQRNGYCECTLETRLGPMYLRIAKLRTGSCLLSFLEPRKASGQALVAVVQEAYVKGIPIRKVDDLVQAMGMSDISKSQVSRLCEEQDERVETFLNRPLEGPSAYVTLVVNNVQFPDGIEVERV